VQPRQVLRAGIRRRLVHRDVRQRHEPEPRRQVSPASSLDSVRSFSFSRSFSVVLRNSTQLMDVAADERIADFNARRRM